MIRWAVPELTWKWRTQSRFLASEEASYITGHVLKVNGGMLMAKAAQCCVNRDLFSSFYFRIHAVLLWSAIHPHDYFTLDTGSISGDPRARALAVTYRKFQFTPLFMR